MSWPGQQRPLWDGTVCWVRAPPARRAELPGERLTATAIGMILLAGKRGDRRALRSVARLEAGVDEHLRIRGFDRQALEGYGWN